MSLWKPSFSATGMRIRWGIGWTNFSSYSNDTRLLWFWGQNPRWQRMSGLCVCLSSSWCWIYIRLLFFWDDRQEWVIICITVLVKTNPSWFHLNSDCSLLKRNCWTISNWHHIAWNLPHRGEYANSSTSSSRKGFSQMLSTPASKERVNLHHEEECKNRSHKAWFWHQPYLAGHHQKQSFVELLLCDRPLQSPRGMPGWGSPRWASHQVLLSLLRYSDWGKWLIGHI